MNDAEQKRGLVDEMLRRRIETSGETGDGSYPINFGTVANLPDDTAMLVNPDGNEVDARTIRVWASFYRTPERKQ